MQDDDDMAQANGNRKTVLTLQQIVTSRNVAQLLTADELDEIGKKAVEGYEADLKSRSGWEERMANAIKLALQVRESKTFPWVDCSNVKFPLLTIAALQFLARVSVMTKGKKLAKLEFVGADPTGDKFQRASRISSHISLQLREEDANWMDHDEQVKLAAAIMGAAFKKTYLEPLTGRVLSEHVPASALVIDYYCRDIAKAQRITHVLSLSDNVIQSRVRQGLYLDADLDDTTETPEATKLKSTADQIEGLTRPSTDAVVERMILEQQCWLDLDGDGYKEPYVLVTHKNTGKVLRIVARFTDTGDVLRTNDAKIRSLERQLGEIQADVEQAKLRSQLEKEIDKLEKAKDNVILNIEPIQYYTRYLFIPSPDGGVYGLGLGALLGPLNESVDSLINQLIDAGTMANTAGGFLGRGVKIKTGNQTFSPFEWKPVDAPGQDLRNNVFPLPVRDPSAVLFQLLSLLINYGEKVGSSTDVMTGENPGQNTPAETSRNTLEQGMMLFSGIYGRMYRGFKEELTKFYNFNKLYFEYSPRYYDFVEGPDAILSADDYKSNSYFILPAASPEDISQTKRLEKAKNLDAIASSRGGFNMYLVTKQILEALEIDDIENLYPDPRSDKAIQPGIDPKIEQAQKELAQRAKEHQDKMALAVAELQNEIRLTDAKIIELQAQARNEIAQANGVDTGHQIALINAKLGAERDRRNGLLTALSHLTKVSAIDGKAAAAKDAALMQMDPPSPGGGAELTDVASPMLPGQSQSESTISQGAMSDGNNEAGPDGMGASPGDQGIPAGAEG